MSCQAILKNLLPSVLQYFIICIKKEIGIFMYKYKAGLFPSSCDHSLMAQNCGIHCLRKQERHIKKSKTKQNQNQKQKQNKTKKQQQKQKNNKKQNKTKQNKTKTTTTTTTNKNKTKKKKTFLCFLVTKLTNLYKGLKNK